MIDQAKIRSIIESNGNHFHSKVVTAFEEREWSVLISPYYNDNITDKPREIDIVAEKAFPVHGQFGQLRGDVDIRLCIECKYVPHATVFWFHYKDQEKARDLVLRSTPLKDNNTNTNKHHYLCTNPQVAKLFATERQQSTEGEAFYKALNQSLNAMVHFRHSKAIIPDAKRGNREKIRPITYPVIMSNSFERFFRVTIGSDQAPAPIDENFQLEVNYAYVNSGKNHQQEYFLIDVVDFKRLDEYLNTLENDLAAILMFV